MFAGVTWTAKQAAILESRSKFTVLTGAMQASKSMTGSALFVLRILQDINDGKSHPLTYVGPFNKSCVARATYWIVSPTHELAKIIVAYVQSFMPDHMRQDFDAHSQTMYLRTDRGYVKIVVKSAERPDRAVGDRVDGMIIDEAARCDGRLWRGALRSRLATTGGWAIFSSSPKDGRSNWLHTDIIARHGTDPDVACFTLAARDNPSILPSEIEDARRQLPKVYFERDWLGLWSSWSGGVYSFDRAAHVITEAQLRMEYGIGATGDLRKIVTKAWGGADFGWTDPACLLIGLETNRDELIITDEFYASNVITSGQGMASGTLLAEAWDRHRRWNVNTWLCDSNDPEAIDAFCRSGLNARRAHKAIVDGVRKVSVRLHVNPATKRPRLRILSDKCPHLVDELGRLSWKMDRNGDAVEGEFSNASPRHSCDAVRYLVAGVDEYADLGLLKSPVHYQAIGVGSGVGWAHR